MNKKDYSANLPVFSFSSYARLYPCYWGAGTDAEGFHQDGKRAYEAGNE